MDGTLHIFEVSNHIRPTRGNVFLQLGELIGKVCFNLGQPLPRLRLSLGGLGFQFADVPGQARFKAIQVLQDAIAPIKDDIPHFVELAAKLSFQSSQAFECDFGAIAALAL